jgi:hypothetical protein
MQPTTLLPLIVALTNAAAIPPVTGFALPAGSTTPGFAGAVPRPVAGIPSPSLVGFPASVAPAPRPAVAPVAPVAAAPRPAVAPVAAAPRPAVAPVAAAPRPAVAPVAAAPRPAVAPVAAAPRPGTVGFPVPLPVPVAGTRPGGVTFPVPLPVPVAAPRPGVVTPPVAGIASQISSLIPGAAALAPGAAALASGAAALAPRPGGAIPAAAQAIVSPTGGRPSFANSIAGQVASAFPRPLAPAPPIVAPAGSTLPATSGGIAPLPQVAPAAVGKRLFFP